MCRVPQLGVPKLGRKSATNQALDLPFKGKNRQRKTHGPNLPLLGLQRAAWADLPLSPLRLRPHAEGSRSISDSPEASAPGVSDTGRPPTVSPPHLSPRDDIVHLRLARDRPPTPPSHWCTRDLPWCHPCHRVCLTRQVGNDWCQITMPTTATSMGESCWPLCHPW
jgi:hypothetical protein